MGFVRIARHRHTYCVKLKVFISALILVEEYHPTVFFSSVLLMNPVYL